MIIFDLDGTLVDTKHLHQASFQWALSQEDPSYILTEQLKDQLEGIPSLTKIDYLRKHLEWNLDTSRVYQNKQTHTLTHLHQVSFCAGLPDRLRELSKHHTLCLASNARSGFVFRILNHMQLDVFTIVLTASYIPLSLAKPNPHMFIQCMEMTQTAPDQTIVFEDSEVGVAAAKASGARTQVVKNSTDTYERIIDLCR